MTNIIPITDLRNTVKIDQLVNKANEPIFVTKNGYSDLVIMSHDYYLSHFYSTKKNQKLVNSFINKEMGEIFGFVKLKTVTIEVSPSDINYNKKLIFEEIEKASREGVYILEFQELALSGITIEDSLTFSPLLKKCEKAIKEIIEFSKNYDMLIAFGAPFKHDNKIYNAAFVVLKGDVLSIVPKKNVSKHFSILEKDEVITFNDEQIYFGNNALLIDNYYPDLKIGVVVGDDILSPYSNLNSLALNGATLILNLGGYEELLENKDFHKTAIKNLSKMNSVIIATSNAGKGESTYDSVYSGHQYIYELGDEVSSNKPFDKQTSLLVDIDIEKVSQYRIKNKFKYEYSEDFSFIGFNLIIKNPTVLHRFYYKNPFIKDEINIDVDLVKYILNIQAFGLVKRLKAIGQQKVIIGLSGGLDSTLTLLVAYEAFKILDYPTSNIICVSMPAFGTTSKTKNNASSLAIGLGVDFREIDISNSVIQHLKDIGHDLSIKDVTYENAQARERTQVIMDIANKEGALQLGTGDLSELCLGWCTYNGDQMSMYSTNSSIPKTMVKFLCKGYALINKEISSTLLDIVDTPISPELIPGKEDKIAQKTEDIIGPYFLHDFIIYHFLSYAYSPKKLYFILTKVFKDDLSEEEILKWLKVFFRRFFQNQFKRVATPDGIKISKISISKKDLSLPSDISSRLFLEELETI